MSPDILAGVIVFSSFIGIYGLELIGGRIQASPRPWRDAGFTLVGLLSQSILSSAVVGTLAGLLVASLFPANAGAWTGTPFWLAFPLIFVLNEFCHYWLHRAAHEWRWLWKIHRTHHSAQELNTGVLYRYNVFWVLMIPHSWIGVIAVYFGLGSAFIAAVLSTYFVNALTHTSYRWDLWLRRRMPWSEPLWRVLEKIITLPDAHHAHHATAKKHIPMATTPFRFSCSTSCLAPAKPQIPDRRTSVCPFPLACPGLKSCSGHWSNNPCCRNQRNQ